MKKLHLVIVIVIGMVSLGLIKFEEATYFAPHPEESDRIVIAVNDDLDANIYFKRFRFWPKRGIGERNWRPLGRYKSKVIARDGIDLHKIRSKGDFSIKIEFDAELIRNYYPNPDFRPVFNPGNDFEPYADTSYFDGDVWVFELFVNELPRRDDTKLNSLQVLQSHFHGHMCPPDDPSCGS